MTIPTTCDACGKATMRKRISELAKGGDPCLHAVGVRDRMTVYALTERGEKIAERAA